MRNFPRISRRTISSSSLSHLRERARAAEKARARSPIPTATTSLWEWAKASRISDRIISRFWKQSPKGGKSGLHRTMVLVNGQERQRYGKCSREQTAYGQG